jgi:hypothetical protein
LDLLFFISSLIIFCFFLLFILLFFVLLVFLVFLLFLCLGAVIEYLSLSHDV